jgi:protein-disulfide isomerase
MDSVFNGNKKLLMGSIVGGIVLVVFLFVIYAATNGSSTKPVTVDEAKAIRSDDHIRWSPDKKVILTEYGDFQCPACGAFHELIQNQIEKPAKGEPDLTKKITFVFRNYPLTQVHQNAIAGAQAVEAAGLQGKYWEMYDEVYNSQQGWSDSKNVLDNFVGYAKDLKLDIDKFKSDYSSQAVKDRIQKDIDSGDRVTIRATPTFFLNGVKMENYNTFDDFKKQLQDAVK